ncbi:divisome protein SepX/GlpR [Mycolicibacterium sp.]|uniref:divisome protein SepX/GlpR n=1 Tax=Mycolicibacterium sp. TaxID=2320850 RepID=UPI003D09F90F
MPSIPQSLLWISLVVLWLFVLVPMLISKRDAVRRTSDVALATRVLNSGSARLRRRTGPAAGHRSDPDWRPSGEDADHLDEVPGRSVVMVAEAADAADEPDYLDVDVVEDSAALPPSAEVLAEKPEVSVRATETDELTLDYDADADADADDDADDDGADYDDTDYDADEDHHDEGVEAVDDAEYEYVDDSSGLEAPAEDDLRLADSMSAARRRRRESSTAAAVTARKYRFRTRTLSVMAVLVLASGVAAYTWSATMWWACGSIAALTLLYLAYLRRQTRIEEQVRRRRAQRMARSRLGVENTEDREFDVVPARLRRPGAAVLEIDDEDPEFEHLDHVRFSRHYDLPRAAGQ